MAKFQVKRLDEHDFIVEASCAGEVHAAIDDDSPGGQRDTLHEVADRNYIGCSFTVTQVPDSELAQHTIGRSNPEDITVTLQPRQHATVLAALRYWQREGLMSSGHEQDISTNGGTLDQLTEVEIDHLIEDHLN